MAAPAYARVFVFVGDPGGVALPCEDVPYRSTRTNGRTQPSKTYYNNAANTTTTGTGMVVEVTTLHAAGETKEIVN